MSALLKSYEKTQANSQVLIVQQGTNREIIKDFTINRFRSVYGADVQDFLPNSLALVDKNMQLKAAIGYQSAADHFLFLEQYLDQRVEQSIAQHLGANTPKRSEIVEVGNLSSTSSGGTRRLILNLAHYFRSQGFKWMVMTAIPQVINSFEKLGIEMALKPLTQAKSEDVQCSLSTWGSYYEHDPVVVFGNIQTGIDHLESNELMCKLMQRVNFPIQDTQIQLSVEGAKS